MLQNIESGRFKLEESNVCFDTAFELWRRTGGNTLLHMVALNKHLAAVHYFEKRVESQRGQFRRRHSTTQDSWPI